MHNIRDIPPEVLDHSAWHILINDYGSPQCVRVWQSPFFHGDGAELWSGLCQAISIEYEMFEETLEELTLALERDTWPQSNSETRES